MDTQAEQREDLVYHYIIKYCRSSRGIPPTLREITKACNLHTISTTAYYVDKLVRRGLLRRAKSRARGIQVIGAIWISPTTCRLCSKEFLL